MPDAPPGTDPSEQPGKTSPMANSSSTSKTGEAGENEKAKDQALKQPMNSAEGDSRGDASSKDANQADRRFEKDPWFAKLPPALRGAIQSKSRGKAPRGYEERLKRYFESVD